MLTWDQHLFGFIVNVFINVTHSHKAKGKENKRKLTTELSFLSLQQCLTLTLPGLKLRQLGSALSFRKNYLKWP